MNNQRYFHTASVLPNGTVLVIGGSILNNSTSSCELYDALRRNWTAVGSMVHGRGRHTGSVLTNGKVLVAGGNQDDITLNSTELY